VIINNNNNNIKNYNFLKILFNLFIEKDDEIRKNNQNILNRMIYQGKNNVGTSNLDDNNDVIEPVFRSLHADQNRRLENEMNRESMVILLYLLLLYIFI